MPNLTSVGVTAGVPTSGTGTVSTIDNLIGTAGTAATQVLSVQGIASGTAITSSANLQLAGTAVTGGAGATAAGTPRVTLASDSPGITALGQTTMSASLPVTMASNQSKILVTPDSVALPANQSVNVAQVAGATTAVGSGVQATALRTTLATDSPGLVTLGQTTKSASVPVTVASDQALVVTQGSQYPSGATAITASTTGTTGATTATLAGTSGKTTYISGFTITSDATAALAGTATVTGTITGTLNFIQNVGGATAAGILTQAFNPAIPASATNTGIAVNSVAAGTGGNTAVTAWGYQL